MTPKTEDVGKPTCGCGRSPDGYCRGWHALTNEQYQVKLAEHNSAEKKQLLSEYTSRVID